MRLSPIAYGTFVIPCGVTAFCVALTSFLGSDLPVCFPLMQGCVSIREVMLEGPNAFLFSLFILSAAFMMAWFWMVASPWISAWDHASGRCLLWMGWLGAAGLGVVASAVNSTFSGGELVRGIGAWSYFFFAGSSVVFLSIRIWPLGRKDASSFPKPVRIGLVVASLLVVGFGLVYAFSWVRGVHQNLLNVLQWNLALFLQIHFGLISILWRRQQVATTLQLPENR